MRNLTGSQCNRFRIGVERLKRGALVTTLARQFLVYCKKVSYNNRICLLLTSATVFCLARSKDRFFSNSTQITDMIEVCPTCLGYMFPEIQAFWLMQMDLCLDLELSMGNYLGFFFR